MLDNKEYFSIGRVERDTGIARDTLRVWERRYGFPDPQRSAQGERQYSQSQVAQLHRVKRLLDQGLRPSRLLAMDTEQLLAFEAKYFKSESDIPESQYINELIDTVYSGSAERFRKLLFQLKRRSGLTGFIVDVLSPLLRQVGEAWSRGDMQIHHEHFITQQLTQFLYTELSKMKLPDKPAVILATLPGEAHGLGLLMLMAVLAERGHYAVNLGTHVPAKQLADAAQHYQARYVGVTFSSAYQYSKIRGHVNELREMLDPEIQLWVGGEGVSPLRKLQAGIVKVTGFERLPEILN